MRSRKESLTNEKAYVDIINRIMDSIDNNKIIWMISVSIVALALRFIFLNLKGGDYDSFLSKWCEYLRLNGGFKAIVSVDTDYNAIYLYFLALFSYIPIKDLYLIKMLSFIFDFVMAFSAYKIVAYLKKDDKYKNTYSVLAFSGVLLMPTVIVNGARWVQCDSIYTAFIMLSLYYMMKKKYNLSFILYGVAITFKLQAIFILPAYGIICLRNKEFSIFKFMWIPIVNFVLYIPALIIGKPLISIFDAYLCQVGKYAYKTVLGYPNIYYFFSIKNVELIRPGIILTMCLLFCLMFFVLFTKGKINELDILELGIVVVFVVTFFLPEMHDRYAYVAEVLSMVYFILIKKDWIILLLININARITYASFLDGVPESVMPFISILQAIVVGYFICNFIYKRLRNVDEEVIDIKLGELDYN